jgi:hypothetical protein
MSKGSINRTPTGYRNRKIYFTMRHFPRFIEKIPFNHIFYPGETDGLGHEKGRGDLS